MDTPKRVNILYQRFDYLVVIIKNDACEIRSAMYTRGKKA